MVLLGAAEDLAAAEIKLLRMTGTGSSEDRAAESPPRRFAAARPIRTTLRRRWSWAWPPARRRSQSRAPAGRAAECREAKLATGGGHRPPCDRPRRGYRLNAGAGFQIVPVGGRGILVTLSKISCRPPWVDRVLLGAGVAACADESASTVFPRADRFRGAIDSAVAVSLPAGRASRN
jgi:hypothetical protein